MRKSKTPAEKRFFILLQQAKIHFRSQRPLGYYIVDFIVLNKKIVIEIDGEYHQTPEQRLSDEARTGYIERAGFKVIRFTNQQVFSLTNLQLKKIIDGFPDIQYCRKKWREFYGFAKF